MEILYKNEFDRCCQVTLSDETYIVLGSAKDMEPEWRRNDAGGIEHYTYAGEQCYVPYLYVRDVTSGELLTYSLNGRFVSAEHPSVLPQEWCKEGEKFKLSDNGKIWWESEYSRYPVIKK